MACEFCYKAAPEFVVVFSKGREIHVCSHIYCLGRLSEISREEFDDVIHSIEKWEA